MANLVEGFNKLFGEITRLMWRIDEAFKEGDMKQGDLLVQYKDWCEEVNSFFLFQQNRMKDVLATELTDLEKNEKLASLFKATFAYMRSQLQSGQQSLKRMAENRGVDIRRWEVKGKADKMDKVVKGE
jgi:hypothetical protein